MHMNVANYLAKEYILIVPIIAFSVQDNVGPTESAFLQESTFSK